MKSELKSGVAALGLSTQARARFERSMGEPVNGPDDVDRLARQEVPRMSFGEAVVEALGEFVDAKLDYDRTRQGPSAEYANSDPVSKAAERLQQLLDASRVP